jgi:hypothetical protein
MTRRQHGYDGRLTIIKKAVAAWRRGQAEVFVPLAHRPGEAQVDFGEAEVVLNGEPTKLALFVMTLPYSPPKQRHTVNRIYQRLRDESESFWPQTFTPFSYVPT